MTGRGEQTQPDRKRQPEVAAIGRSRSRAVMARPPPRMTIRSEQPGARGSPPEIERLDHGAPEQKEGPDKPDVRGIEDMGAPIPDEVFGEQRCRRDRGEEVPPVPVQWSPGGCPTTRRIRATPLPVSMALLARRSCRLRESPYQLDEGAGQDGGEDLRHRHCEPSAVWPRTWMEMITAAR